MWVFAKTPDNGLNVARFHQMTNRELDGFAVKYTSRQVGPSAGKLHIRA